MAIVCISVILALGFTNVAAFSGVLRHQNRIPSALKTSPIRQQGLRHGLSMHSVKEDKTGAIPKWCIQHDNGDTAEIYSLGACVTSYKHAGKEMLAIRPDAKLDGSKPISGGIPFCWPQFGPGEMQQHGFARNLEWSMVEASWLSDPCLIFQLTNNEETMAMWPHAFKLLYVVRLTEEGLYTDLQVMNTGDDAFSFTGALHSYFDVSSLDKLKINGGFKGSTYLDKLQDPAADVEESADSLVIKEAYDRVYKGVTGTVELEDSGKANKLAISASQGWTDTVLWSPYGDEGMGYNGFVCAEVACAVDPVTVEPGKSWFGKMALVATAMAGAAPEPVAAVEPEPEPAPVAE